MKDFVVYDNDTGMIKRYGSCLDESISYQAQSGENEAVLEGVGSYVSHYVDISTETHVLTSKAESPATINASILDADNIDFILIDNIPDPTTVSVTVPEGATRIDPVIVDDGDLSFTCNFKGIYVLTLKSVFYLEKTFTVTAS